MIDFLNSINQTKVDLIRTSYDPSVEEKAFPPFPVMRSLSYSQDTLFIVNELNIHSTVFSGLSKLQQYDFLMKMVPKGRRFAKWAKSDKDEAVDFLVEHYKYSHTKAKDAASLLSSEDIRELLNSRGGN
jgi:hypothetical protein